MFTNLIEKINHSRPVGRGYSLTAAAKLPDAARSLRRRRRVERLAKMPVVA